MKIAFIIFSLFIILVLVLFFTLAISSRSGKPPGLFEGRLSKCPDTPNCVCSEYKDDTGHYIEPIQIPKNHGPDIMPVLEQVIGKMGGNILTQEENYLAATFKSKIFGFVDDLEIRIDLAKSVIHIRSASRVGRGDMGVNKKRADLLKKLFNY
jgi:uncharacterized protein (DUF1499 family)